MGSGIIKKISTSFNTRTYGYTHNAPHRELWKEISDEFNGEFKIGNVAANDIEIHRITIPHGDNFIKISISDTRPLVFEIQFSKDYMIDLTITRDDLVEKILRIFGGQKMKSGLKEFDNKYILRTDSREVLPKIFSQNDIRTITRINIYSLAIHSENKQKKTELSTVVGRVIRDKETIKELILMHKSFIDKILKA